MKYEWLKNDQNVEGCTRCVLYEFLHNVSTELSTDIVEKWGLEASDAIKVYINIIVHNTIVGYAVFRAITLHTFGWEANHDWNTRIYRSDHAGQRDPVV